MGMTELDPSAEMQQLVDFGMKYFDHRCVRNGILPSPNACQARNEAGARYDMGEYDAALGQIVLAHAVYYPDEPMGYIETKIALKFSWQNQKSRKENAGQI